MCLVVVWTSVGYGQQVDLVTPLHDSINETSGLIFLNDKLITHNDSGGDPILYEIDSLTGEVSRAVVISNATNIDWEDLSFDDTYIYVADFGNNNGTRIDLRVYRVLISDYFNTINDTVLADTIEFSYLDQTSFTSSTFSTNYDAEAIISWNDSLYIFTKNWGNNWTNIYALPKVIGTHQIEKIDSINSEGLVTGGTYDLSSNSIMLTGYATTDPFIIEIKSFTSNEFSAGNVERNIIQMPTGYSYQIESVAALSENQYYISSEESFSGNSGLFRLELDIISGVNSTTNNPLIIYPNPVSDILVVKSDISLLIEIYNMNGQLKLKSAIKQIDISDLANGTYLAVVKNLSGEIIWTEKIITH